ncbi:hypothetical protein ACLKA6_019825 [Drosophila palustris]
MDMANRRSYPGTGIALIMRNQQLTYQGFGSLRLLLGFLILFVIWHQCRAYPLKTICSRRPEDCKNVKLFYEGRECVNVKVLNCFLNCFYYQTDLANMSDEAPNRAYI